MVIMKIGVNTMGDIFFESEFALRCYEDNDTTLEWKQAVTSYS